MKKFVCRSILITIICIGSIAVAAPTYTGSLNGSTSGGLIGTNPAGNPWLSDKTTLSWTVTDYQNGTFGYEYKLTVPSKGISHFIIEVSPTFEYSNLIQFGTGYLDNYGPGTQGNSNPSIPGLMRGIKTGSGNLSYTLSFISDRMPVWGDFYAKSGVGGGSFVAIWNAGFVAGEIGNGNDPTDPYGNGSVNNHILVPDSKTPPVVPAPAAIVLGAMGTGLVGFLRRRHSL